MKFKKNIHKAKEYTLEMVRQEIKDYDKRYSTPKYLQFMQKLLELGWQVKLYKAGVSKYIFVKSEDEIYKIRFSNHRPILHKELEKDCDFYVGISNTSVHSTDDIIKILTAPNLFKS